MRTSVALLYPGDRAMRDRCESVGLAHSELPLLWDCDFMLGERAQQEAERYVLCEINVSSVSPFPPAAIGPLVAAVRRRLG